MEQGLAGTPRDKREHVRLVPGRPGEFRLLVVAEGRSIEARLADYSAFGMGAILPWSEETARTLAQGRVFVLQCVFGGSRFPSKGRVANAVAFDEDGARWLRVGFALVSEATPTRERLSQRRSELRLEVDSHLSPMCVCEDELLFGDRVFLRARDVSASGMALELPGERVPFLPKQRVWLGVLVPFFGEFRAFARVAWIRKSTGVDGEPNHLVGVTFLRGVADVSPPLCDYLFYTHGEFSQADLRAAGFDVGHLGGADDQLRPRVVRSQAAASSGDGEEVEFQVEDARGEVAAQGLLALEAGGSRLALRWFRDDGLTSVGSLLKFLCLFAHAHACESIFFCQEAREGLAKAWPDSPETMRLPEDLARRVPLRALVILAPLFRRRLDAPRGTRGKVLRVLGGLGGMLDA
jgi:hypothetical protein